MMHLPSPSMTLAPSRWQLGSSLLEVLVAILIVSFGILGLVGLQAKATSLSIDAEDRTRAALIANDYVSAVQLQRSIDLPKETLDALDERAKKVHSGGLNDAKVSLTDSGVSNMATVSVSWCPVSDKQCAASTDTSGDPSTRARYTTIAIVP